MLLGAERYQPQAQDASAWVFSIARHKLLSSRRRRRVEDRARRELGYEPVLLEDGDVEAIDDLVGDRGALDGLVDQLPPHERFAVLERVVKGRAYRELAADLRCSEMMPVPVCAGAVPLRAACSDVLDDGSLVIEDFPATGVTVPECQPPGFCLAAQACTRDTSPANDQQDA